MLLFSSTPCPKGEKGGRELTCAGILFFFNLLILEREEKGEEGRERERERKKERGRERRERNIKLLFCLFIHSLVDFCMCPNWGWNLRPWHIWTSLQPTELPDQGQCWNSFSKSSRGTHFSSGTTLGGYAGKQHQEVHV